MNALRNARSNNSSNNNSTRGANASSNSSLASSSNANNLSAKKSASGKVNAIKSLNQQKGKNKRVFGERCFDYISSCRHKITSRQRAVTSKDPNFVACPYCRLINLTLKPFFLEEEKKRIQAKEESLRNRSLLRTKLLYQWSQSRSFHYQYMELDNCVDFVWSNALAACIIQNDSLLEFIQKKVKHSFWFNDEPQNLTIEDSAEKLNFIDFDEMMKILYRNQRVNEIGHIAATFLQSYIRKYLAKQRVRRLILKRFEYIPPTKYSTQEFYYDTTRLRKWNHKPRLIQNERPGTPSTIQRRLNHEQKLKQKKFESYQTLIKTEQAQFEKNPFHALSFFEKDVRIIRYMKQLVVVYDLLTVSMNHLAHLQKLKAQKKEEEDKAASANDLLSQLSSVSIGGNNNKKDASTKEITVKTIEDDPVLENGSSAVWIIPAPPGLPARELGLSIALLTVTSPARAISRSASALIQTPVATPHHPVRRGQSVSGQPVLLNPMQRALQVLEQHIWQSLICHSPEEIIQKLLIKDLIPIYESVMNFSHDEFGIWNGKYAKIPPPPPADPTPAASNPPSHSSSARSLMSPSASFSLGPAGSMNNLSNNNMSFSSVPPANGQPETVDTPPNLNPCNINDEILPFGFQIRPVVQQDVTPNGFFRLFFFEEELVGVSSASPWVFYPEIWKNREAILSSIVRFAATNQIKAFIHNVYRTANKTHPKYQQNLVLPPPSASDNKGRKQSIVSAPPPGNPKGRKQSVAGKGAGKVDQNDPLFKASKVEPATSLFVPSEESLFTLATPVATTTNTAGTATTSTNNPTESTALVSLTTTSLDGIVGTNASTASAAPAVVDKRVLYDETFLQDINNLTEEQVMKIYEKYKFARRNRGFFEKYKRVSQNITKRKEKERKERMERQKQLLYASQSISNDEADAAPAPTETTSTATAADTASHPVALPYGFSGLNQKKAAPPKPSIFDKLSWKKSFHETAKSLKGPSLYDFYVPAPPPPPEPDVPPKKKPIKRTNDVEDEKNNKKNEETAPTTSTQEEVIDESQWHDYIKKLFDVSVQVDANMTARINAPPGLLENYPVAQLFAMDVYVTLPKPARPDTSNKRGTTPTNHHSASTFLFPVELYQVIGIFPCESEKCPANLDCGLFDYEFFHRLYVEQQRKLLNPPGSSLAGSDDASVGSTHSGSTMASSSVTNPSGLQKSSHHHETDPIRCYNIKEKNWNPADMNTGVAYGKAHTPTGVEFQFQLLGQWPNKEFMEKNLPRKVKVWLGLPT